MQNQHTCRKSSIHRMRLWRAVISDNWQLTMTYNANTNNPCPQRWKVKQQIHVWIVYTWFEKDYENQNKRHIPHLNSPIAQHSTRYLVNHLWLMWIRVRQAGPVKMWCQPQPQPQPHSFSHPNQALFSTSDPIFTEAPAPKLPQTQRISHISIN